MTQQERKDPLLERSDDKAARRARQRTLLIGLGLVALSGTSLFAAIDQFRLRQAVALSPPCRIQEEQRAVLPAVFIKEFPAPMTQASKVTSGSAVSAGEMPSTPTTSGSTHLARGTVPASALGHASAFRSSESPAESLSAAADKEVVGWGEPETTGALAPLPNTSRSPKVALAKRMASGAECPSAQIREVLADISARFGPLTVIATDQQKTANHRSGSTREKLHHGCKAVDFRPERGRTDEIKTYLRSRGEIDGVESYRDGVIHMDVSSRGAQAPGLQHRSTPDLLASRK